MHASYETIKLNKTLFFLKELLPIDLLGYYLKTKRYQITKLMCDYLSSHLAIEQSCTKLEPFVFYLW